MANELTVTVSGLPCTGKGVIGMIIEKALQDHGVTAKYRNDDLQSEESLREAYNNRSEILKKIDPQITIVEEHVRGKLKLPFRTVEEALANEIVMGSGDPTMQVAEIHRLLGMFRASIIREAGVVFE
jgi:hypothetical protein